MPLPYEMKRTFFLALSFLFLVQASSAQSNLTLQSIWASNALSPATVPGFNFLNDGRHYTRLEQNSIRQYDLTNGQLTATLLNGNTLGLDGSIADYAFSPGEDLLLIQTGREPIYRRSSRANFFIYDRASRELTPLYAGNKVQYATFNPQANRVAFVMDNNLYYRDLARDEIIQVTDDGLSNAIINGAADWVYEEEFGFAKAFFWSPDGERLAFIRFDERKVPEFTLTNYRQGLYPEYQTFKYPKVGEANSLVSVHIYDLASGQTVDVQLEGIDDQYIPRIKWTQDPKLLCVYRMNRHQNELDLLLAHAETGATRVLLQEREAAYISEYILDNLTFLSDGQHFLWSSERDGWHHLYLFDMEGELVRQLTRGDWEVDAFYGVDEANGEVYYQSTEGGSTQRQVYALGLDGQAKRLLAGEPGWNEAQFSSTYDYFVLQHSDANTPARFAVYDRALDLLRTIEDNAALQSRQEMLNVQPVTFLEIPLEDGPSLNAYMIRPPDFSETEEYPLLMYVYGGPGSQNVRDAWLGQNYWWFQLLAQEGYLVACVDNRGTGGRGEAFKKLTYLQLGHYETLDQIASARYLANLPYVDAGRIGIFGWSYGGYMSSLCLLKGSDVFRAAIAVAPVTNWRWYDTIYTERYMRTAEENPEGYRLNSPVYFADRLRGSYLIVHGMGDDNVHFQNTAEMVNALVEANRPFETYFYPNRNHGIYGGYTRLHLYSRMTEFLDENLKQATGLPEPGKP